MSSDPYYLHDLLLQLHHELKHTKTIPERDRQLFEHLAAHVQELIEKPDSTPTTLSAKLEATLAETEADHPRLTAVMERVVSALSSIGI